MLSGLTAARGINDHNVVLLVRRRRDTVEGNDNRVPHAIAGLGGEHLDARPLTDDLELVDGIGALEVGRNEQRRVALVLEVLGKLAGECRFTGALEAREHDDGRRVFRELEPAGRTAENLHKFGVHDLDDLLRGVEGLRHLGA